MENEAKENLAHQALAKFSENPSFKPSQEELDAVLFLVDEQVDYLCSKITYVFDAQNKYVQKNIRRHEIELIEARLNGLSDSDMDILLKRCRLRPDLVSPSVVWCCLDELTTARWPQSLLTESELGKDAAREYEKYFCRAPTVDMQAEGLGLTLIEPDMKGGQYIGPVVGMDHRAALVKFCQDKAVVVPFVGLAEGKERPQPGDTVRMKFSEGVLVVSVIERHATKRAKALEAAAPSNKPSIRHQVGVKSRHDAATAFLWRTLQ